MCGSQSPVSVQVTELPPIHTGVCKEGTSSSYNAGHALGVNSRCQTQPLGTPPPQPWHTHTHTPVSPSYQWLFVLIGFDAADKIGLAVGQDSHQLVQRLLELAREGDRALDGV